MGALGAGRVLRPEVKSPFLASLGRAGLTSSDSRLREWGGEGQRTAELRVGRRGDKSRVWETRVCVCVCVYVCVRERVRGGRGKRKTDPTSPCHVVSTPAMTV